MTAENLVYLMPQYGNYPIDYLFWTIAIEVRATISWKGFLKHCQGYYNIGNIPNRFNIGLLSKTSVSSAVIISLCSIVNSAKARLEQYGKSHKTLYIFYLL